MIIRILNNTKTVNITPSITRVIRVFNHRVPSGITESLFTAAGQLLGSNNSDSPVVIPAPSVEGQLLVARLGEAVKMTWETVDLSQLTQTAVKTAAYTASNNDHVLVDISGASADFAITLPATPTNGSKVRVSLVAGHATYKITIGRNGSYINGSTSTDAYNMNVAGDSWYFEYTGSTLGWLAIAGRQPNLNVEYLVVGGGGGGGGNSSGNIAAGGGGGGGDVKTGTIRLERATNYTVTVGAGGSGTTGMGTAGSSSVFNTVASTGGGPGGSYDTPTGSGLNGANGGGGAGRNVNETNTGGTGAAGYNGGTGYSVSGAKEAGAGGAGDGGAGVSASVGVGGNGGAGVSSSISGFSVSYAGGGGGGAAYVGSAGTAGTGTNGGGNGAQASSSGGANGSSGTANKGGGGGGGANANASFSGGNGGSGVVILKYPSVFSITIGAGLTGSEGAPSGGYKVATITAGTGNVSWT